MKKYTTPELLTHIDEVCDAYEEWDRRRRDAERKFVLKAIAARRARQAA